MTASKAPRFEIARVDGPVLTTLASVTREDVSFPANRTNRLRGLCDSTTGSVALSFLVNGKEVLRTETPRGVLHFEAVTLSVSSDTAGVDVIFDNVLLKGY